MHVPAFEVNAVDSTAAGDTFIGYYLANRLMGSNVARACKRPAAPPQFPSLGRGPWIPFPSAAKLRHSEILPIEPSRRRRRMKAMPVEAIVSSASEDGSGTPVI